MSHNQDIEEHLKKELEGVLFEHPTLQYVMGSYYATKDFYAVKNGVVIMVNDGKEQVTGDTLFNTQLECHKIGKYNPNITYKKVIKPFTHDEVLQALLLTIEK